MVKREKLQYAMVFAVDLASLVLSTVISWLLLDGVLGVILEYSGEDILQFVLILLLVFLLVFLVAESAQNIVRRTARQEFLGCVRVDGLFAAALAVFLLITKAPLLESRYLYVGVVGGNLVCLFVLRMWLKRYLSRKFYKGSMASLVGVVTTQDRAPEFLAGLRENWSQRIVGVALVDAGPHVPERIESIPVKASFDDFMEWLRREPLDEVYINLPYATGESLMPYLEEMESMGLTIHLNVPALERFLPKNRKDVLAPHLQGGIEELCGVPLVTIAPTVHKTADLIIKRCMDIAGSIVGLILSVPVIAVVAIPLKLESRGPLFVKQKRVGLNCRVFYIYKLRSMYQDAEARKKELLCKNKMQGYMFKMDDDPRITKVGRFIRRTSIDELPQFWNVLRGQMSLVGTRPPTLDEYEQYQSHHKRRLSMKPGITGVWQVSGRSDIQDFEEVVKLDVWYIDNWSLKLDVKLLFKTIAVVIKRTGAE